ncbi:MAG: hypothetical protein Q8K64_05985 [Sediminibacterium sp.]|nr:MAG: hypothetical protein FD183_446 [Chitinophagaceae bacterium]MDP1842953.1 hypothetical protein [Sediminibacterium sp.]TXT29560.1 MAG: hypothetical protein FD136_1839 [Chitinophagaceae bacterium]
MLTNITPEEAQLIQRLRKAKSEAEASKIIETTFNEIAHQANQEEYLNSFATKMNQQLGSINPLYIEDADEWNMIQASKVLFYRIGCKYSAVVH